MIVGALDLGTNTFLCLICDVQDGRVVKILDDQVRVVKLGQGVHQTQRFHEEALSRARGCLQEFSILLRQHKVDRVLAMATSAARDVQNAEELFQIGRELRIPIEVISGEQEAQISFQGSVSSFQDQKSRVVVDVGGGSTELMRGRGQQFETGESVNIGCVRLAEMFFNGERLSDRELADLRTFARKNLQPTIEKILNCGPVEQMLAVAGTPTELARIAIGQFDREKIDGFLLTKLDLESWIKKFSTRTPEQIVKDFDVHPGRASVILVGTVILTEALDLLHSAEFVVSTRGVRFGVALELVKRP